MSDAALLTLRALGWLAATMLLLALSMTPLAQLWRARRTRLAALRRALGIGAALFSLAHFATVYVVYLPAGQRWASVASITWLRSGALALALLVPLLLTSFPRVVRVARVALWKPLHRLAYVAAALVVHHLLLAPFAPRAWVFAFASVLMLGACARLAAHTWARVHARRGKTPDAAETRTDSR